MNADPGILLNTKTVDLLEGNETNVHSNVNVIPL